MRFETPSLRLESNTSCEFELRSPVWLDAYSGTGSRLWDRIHRAASPGSIEPNQVVADDRGNVYVVGGSSGKLDGATDYTDSSGAFIMRVY